MNRHLYLHEIIDIVGQGQYDYMAHPWKEPTNVMPDMLTLQGTFFVCAVGGGRWPQVVNIWDVGTPGGRAGPANVDRTQPEAAQGLLRRLVGRGVAVAHRRVRPPLRRRARAARPPPEIADRGVKGTLFVHEVLQVRPGSRARVPGRGRRGAGAGVARLRPRADRALRGDLGTSTRW